MATKKKEEIKKKNYFQILSNLDIKRYVQRKGRFDYLPWSNAWKELKELHPEATRVVYEDANGMNYHNDGRTCWVKVGVTVNIEGVGYIENIDYLPVLDFKNNPVQVDGVNSFQVNKTIWRSTVKAIGMHGLGLSLWAGEDFPEEEAVKTTTQQAKKNPVQETPLKKAVMGVNHEHFQKTLDYVAKECHKGLDVLISNISKRFKITPAVEKAINKAHKTAMDLSVARESEANQAN